MLTILFYFEKKKMLTIQTPKLETYFGYLGEKLCSFKMNKVSVQN